ncbi:MAG: sugar phosphate isomerase/epimerase [Chloroflexi bacterium]|nr:sugar phosphate isomerase/epimerase [Chloroflexota bacterium]
MRFAFSTLGCPGWTLERAVEAARAYGYEGIELRLLDGEVISPDLVRRHRERIRRVFAESGIALVALGTSARFAVTEAAERRTNEEATRELVELAAELGTPVIRVFGGRLPAGTDPAEGVARVAESLNRVAPVAEQAGVGVALETHDDFSASERVAEVLDRVPSRAIGALWDTHHPYRMGEPLPAIWSRLAGRLLHVHLKDARRRDGDQWDLVLLGEGEVPVREVVRALDLRGYDRFAAVEWEKKWHPEIAEPEVALPQHLAKLREYLS